MCGDVMENMSRTKPRKCSDDLYVRCSVVEVEGGGVVVFQALAKISNVVEAREEGSGESSKYYNIKGLKHILNTHILYRIVLAIAMVSSSMKILIMRTGYLLS